MNGTVNLTGAFCADSLPAASTEAIVTVCAGPDLRRSVRPAVEPVASTADPSYSRYPTIRSTVVGNVQLNVIGAVNVKSGKTVTVNFPLAKVGC
jgi:hypothetical protein